MKGKIQILICSVSYAVLAGSQVQAGWSQSLPVALPEEIRFNPPPVRPEVLLPSSAPSAETACQDPTEILLPNQLGGLSHRGIPTLYVKHNAAAGSITSKSLLLDPAPQPLALELRGPDRTTETILLEVEATEVPGYWSMTPGDERSLQTGEIYNWSLLLPCANQPEPQRLTGWLRPVALPAEMESIAAASAWDKVRFYSQFGLWYDAVEAAFQLPQAEQQSALQDLNRSGVATPSSPRE